MKKHIFSVALVILLAGCMCAVGWNQKPAQSFKPNQEAVLSIYSAEKDCTEEIPLKIEDGTLYECTDGQTWNPIALDGQASEVFSGEHLCVLMEDGRMISDFPTEEELLGGGEEVPLTLGYVVYMADQAREINKSEPFVSINQNVEAIGYHCYEFGVRRLPLYTAHGITEELLQHLHVAAIPCDLDGMAYGSLNAGGRGVEALCDLGV